MSEPIFLANKIIKQMVEHLFPDNLALTFEDYTAIRITFRRLGGSWAAVDQGDVRQIEQLSKVIIAWGTLPRNQNREEKMI